jgi:hypothetical protein
MHGTNIANSRYKYQLDHLRFIFHFAVLPAKYGNIMHIKTLFASAVFLLGLASGSAQATLLQGQTVMIEYFFPQFGTIYDTGTNGNYVVDDNVEIADFYFNFASLDISDNKLSIRFLGQDTITAAPYINGINGFRLSVTPGTVSDFTSVVIDPTATTWNVFNADRLQFGADYILIDWQELSFTFGETLVLNISADQQTVPEPTSLLLVGAALVGFVAARRKA